LNIVEIKVISCIIYVILIKGGANFIISGGQTCLSNKNMILSGWEAYFNFQNKIFLSFISFVAIFYYQRKNIIIKHILYSLAGYLLILANHFNNNIVISDNIIGLE